jgi:hypothetical protein
LWIGSKLSPILPPASIRVQLEVTQSVFIGSPLAIALLSIQRSVMSLSAWLLLPPPTSECTPRNHTSQPPFTRVGRNDWRASSRASAW